MNHPTRKSWYTSLVSLPITILIIATLLISCASNNLFKVTRLADKITVESDEIPADMRTEEFGLIGVLTEDWHYLKNIRESFETYPGKYVLVQEHQVDSIYASDSTFRYVIRYTKHYGEGPRSPMYFVARFYILDKRYKYPYYNKRITTRDFSFELKALLMAIERERLKTE